MSKRRPPARHDPQAAPDALSEDEAGALRIGPTDQGMVRFIITTPAGDLELDYPPEEAEDIADELRAAAEIARRGSRR